MTQPTFGELRELTLLTRLAPKAVWAVVEGHRETSAGLVVQPSFRMLRRGRRLVIKETGPGLHGPAAIARVEPTPRGSTLQVRLEYRPDALTALLTAVMVVGVGVAPLVSAGQLTAALALGAGVAAWLPSTLYVNQRRYARELESWLAAHFPPPAVLGDGPYRALLPAPDAHHRA